MLPIQMIMQTVKSKGIAAELPSGKGQCKQQLDFSKQFLSIKQHINKQAVKDNSDIPFQESKKAKSKAQETINQLPCFQSYWFVANQVPVDLIETEQAGSIYNGLVPPVLLQSVDAAANQLLTIQNIEKTLSMPTLDTGQYTSAAIMENKLHADEQEQDIKTVLSDWQETAEKGQKVLTANTIDMSNDLLTRKVLDGSGKSELLLDTLEDHQTNKDVLPAPEVLKSERQVIQIQPRPRPQSKEFQAAQLPYNIPVKKDTVEGMAIVPMDNQTDPIQKTWENRTDAVRENIMSNELGDMKKEPLLLAKLLAQKEHGFTGQQRYTTSVHSEMAQDISDSTIKKNALRNKDFMQIHLPGSTISNGTSQSDSLGYETAALKQKLITQPVPNQIADKLVEISGSDKKELCIVLKPENLGEVTLQIISDQEGIHAKIITNNIHVKEEIAQQGMLLREQLKDQGIKLNAIEVQYKEHTQAQNHFYGDGRQRHQQHQQQHQLNQQNAYYPGYTAIQDEQEMIRDIAKITMVPQDEGINYLV